MNSTAEWEAQVEALVAKSTEKMKDLIHEKDELQNKIYKLTQMLQQEEKIKENIRERIKQTQDETTQQLKDKFDYETQIFKKTEELKKLTEEIGKMRDKVQESDKSYTREISETNEKCERNDQSRRKATQQDLADLEAVQREKADLTKQYEMLSQELQQLQIAVYEINAEESRRAEKTNKHAGDIDDLFKSSASVDKVMYQRKTRSMVFKDKEKSPKKNVFAPTKSVLEERKVPVK